MLIAHLSDIHVLDLEGVRFYRFFNKRVTGGLNLLLKRSKAHKPALLEEALERIEALGCDHVFVTGDLTNLALPSEFERARHILEAHVPASRLHVIAGNHDRYTLWSSLTRRFERHFGDYIRTDLPELPSWRGWPYVKLLEDDVALIGVNSGVVQPWLVSGGRVGERQREALAAVLDHPEVRRRFSVVGIHHHLIKPPHKPREFPRGLFDRHAVLEVLLGHEADLVIHGHNHYYGVMAVPRRKARGGDGAADPGQMLICEAGSTTVARYEEELFGGKFNVYRIEDGELQDITSYLYTDHGGFAAWKRWRLDSDRIPVATDLT